MVPFFYTYFMNFEQWVKKWNNIRTDKENKVVINKSTQLAEVLAKEYFTNNHQIWESKNKLMPLVQDWVPWL